MFRFNVAVLLLTAVVFASLWSESEGWRRRRRRWWAPVNCEVNGWGGWGGCSNNCGYGYRYRNRYVWRWSSWGGRGCPHLSESQRCGRPNGGCQQICRSGRCSCYGGYYSYSTYYCGDTNECASNGGRGPCAHLCYNTVGSYYCRCHYGYYLSGRTSCRPVDCGRPNVPNCPGGAYKDQFSTACQKVIVPSCTTTYLNYCNLNCPSNYRLATIGSRSGYSFGQYYPTVSFQNVPRVQCQGNSRWTNYGLIPRLYCRRVNDPPYNLLTTSSRVNEHSPPETVVGQLSCQDWQGNSLKYTIEHSKGYYIFDIQGQALRLKFSPLLNSASKPGVTSPNNQYDVLVRCTDDGSPNMYQEKTLTITILDVNDTPYNLRISTDSVKETASVNAVVGTLQADDDDGRSSDANSPCSSWTVTDSSGAFKLKSPNQLIVARPIDHESQKIHPVTVTCVDYDHVSSSGRQKMTATTILNIIIQDAQEPPISTTLSANDVDENTAVGTTIGTLTAQDADKDSLSFRIVPVSKIVGADANLFSIGSVSCQQPISGNVRTTCTADLKVAAALDWEGIHLILKGPSKVIIPAIVCVQDTAGHQKCTTFQITIHNVNEAPTDISLGSTTIDENSPPGSLVGNVLFTDPDNPTQIAPDGSLIETIHQNPSCVVDTTKNDGRFFTIAGQYPNFDLASATGSAFDYETQSSYKVCVQCDDHGVPNKALTKCFVVTLKDINEAPTAITLSNQKIKENAGVGTQVATVSVTDPDKGQTHVCSIVAGNTSVFEFRGSNLVVKSAVIDYENVDKYEITIQCCDNGKPQECFEDTQDIDIIDVAEKPTDIIWATGSCGVLPENSDAGFNVGELQVLDQDDNENPQCKLLDDISNTFDVQAQNTLTITAGTAAAALNYEKMSNHMLYPKVRCTDTSGQYLDKVMCVNVTDANEPATNITLTSNLVRENEFNAVIGQLVVTGDPDVGQGHNCTILADTPGVNGDDPQFDAINVFYVEYDASTDTNYLKTVSSVDFESLDPAEFDVDIRCFDIPTDGEDPIPIEHYDFKVWMVDVNEYPQSPCVPGWSVTEGQKNGTNVTSELNSWDPDNEISALDKANGTGGQPLPTKQHLTYKLVNAGKVPFVYNQQLQRIEKFGYIDHETLKSKSYSLCINVMDDGALRDPTKTSSQGQPTLITGQPLNMTYCCPISVDDRNEDHTDIKLAAAQTCKGDNSSIFLSEDSATGDLIGTLMTIDEDHKGVHIYSIVQNDEGDIPVKIEAPNKLVVKSGVGIDYEKTKQFFVTIRSTDGQSGYYIERSFPVVVCNVNEQPVTMCIVPVTGISSATPTRFSVPENIVGYRIGQIIVSDPDHPQRHCPGPNNIPAAALDAGQPFVYKCAVESQQSSEDYLEMLFAVTNDLVLVTANKTNFEAEKLYKVPVRCVDPNHPLTHQTIEHFDVHVNNVNEAPYGVRAVANYTYTMPNTAHNCSCMTIYRLVENMPADILKLTWEDQDLGDDHTVTVDGFYGKDFSFDYHSGVLSTTGLSHETNDGCYTVRVTDNGNPKMSGTMSLCLDVLNQPEPANAIRVLCPNSKLYGRPADSPTDENMFTSLAKKDYQFGSAGMSGDCRYIRQCDLKAPKVIGTLVPLDEDQGAQFTFGRPSSGPFQIGTLLTGNLNGQPGGPASAARLEVTGSGMKDQMALKEYPFSINIAGDDGLSVNLWVSIRAYNDCDSTYGTPVPCGANAYLMAKSCPAGGCVCVCMANHVGDPATRCELCPAGQRDVSGSCVDINECASNPCQNGATCLNGDNKFECLCAVGYEGASCQSEIDHCHPNPCKNDGQCVNKIGQASCVCSDAFAGQFCDYHISTCADASVCSADYQCVVSDRATCVHLYDVAQVYVDIASFKLSTQSQKYAFENYVEELMTKGSTQYSLETYLNAAASGRRKRAAADPVYSVRIVDLQAWKGRENSRTLLEIAAFDTANQWKLIKVNEMCPLLKGSDVTCVTYAMCLDVNAMEKKCNPDSSVTKPTVKNVAPGRPTVKAPVVINNPVVVGPARSTGDDGESKPFFTTLWGIVVIVAICVAVIIVASVTVFVVLRKRQNKGAYYEEFNEYDASMAGMPDESTTGDFAAMSGSMRERARGRPRSGLVNPLYDAMMSGEDDMAGTVDNELYKPSDQIKIFDNKDSGPVQYSGDKDVDPLYDNVE
eukprot:m.306112 g.306112  ORF g.306112 m.306112 type:complete len:2176 (+) comp40977_c0_seq1:115-6642(+)